MVTDSNGDKYELTDYYPYGSTRLDEKSGSFENTHKFTGKELDSETGLYYYGQRYYDPSIGRFASEDPASLAVGDDNELKDITKLDLAKYLANPQLSNSYSYVANNPLKFVDKEGEFLDTVIDAGFIVSDIRGIYQDIKSGNNPTMGFAALGLDVVGALTPGLTGLGTGAKALMNAEKAGEAVKVTGGLKGTQNPVIKQATREGQAQHRVYKVDQVSSTFLKEFRFDNGLRADAIDFTNRTIYELKPNNQRAVQTGYRQVQKYVDQANKQFGGGFKGVVDTYKKAK